MPVKPTGQRAYGDGCIYGGGVLDLHTRALLDARFPAAMIDSVGGWVAVLFFKRPAG